MNHHHRPRPSKLIPTRRLPVPPNRVLDDTGIRVSQEDVEQVLKLSYSHPAPSMKFFRWAGFHLNDKHSPYAWNLVVDLLGKNCLFDAMWDAIKSLQKGGFLSLATFASVFSSYVSANRVEEATMTFEVMNQYGVARDIVALNSLLSAMCGDGKTRQAKHFLNTAKDKIRPDMDTYAILLEGFENEKDVSGAKITFSDMVSDIGLDPLNGSAYDSFLTTLIKGREGMLETLKYYDMMRNSGCSPGMKFFKFALEECLRKSDAKNAEYLFEAMVQKHRCVPDIEMYNLMIRLHCNLDNFKLVTKLLDEMVCNGVFPNADSYNEIFQFLINRRRLNDALPIFTEMLKNECSLSLANCSLAVRVCVNSGDALLATKVWKYMIETYKSGLEETGNYLVVKLHEINRLPEAVKYAEDMIQRKIKVNSSTLSKLKQSLSKLGKRDLYEELLLKWKLH
ncbi:hypothetical protein Leryth_027364 [Lithospermum erythrorhizon]|nr:hypothetical protein Leryth_027364 [Lithospermum erythrorhizon]